MNKIAADLAQRRARQLWLRDLMGRADFDNLPAAERRANLVSAWKSLAAKDVAGLSKAQKKERSDKLVVLQDAISEIRKKTKGPADVKDFFIEVARERLGAFQFRTFMNEAANRAREKERAENADVIEDQAVSA